MPLQTRRNFITRSVLAPLGLALLNAPLKSDPATHPSTPDYESDYVVGKGNALAHTAALHVANNEFPHKLSPLILVGAKGTGKTMLLDLTERQMLEAVPVIRIYRTDGERFVNTIAINAQHGSMEGFRETTFCCDVFIIDNFDLIAQSKLAQEEFMRIFHSYMKNAKRIVATASPMWKSDKNLSAEIKTKMAWGGVFPINRSEEKDRLKMAVRMAKKYNLRTGPENLKLVASRSSFDLHMIESDIRRLKLHFGSREASPKLAQIILAQR